MPISSPVLRTCFENLTCITVLGNYLFVADAGDATIGEYTLSGATVNPTFIKGFLGYPDAIAIQGQDLYVANYSGELNVGYVGEYTTDGGTDNAFLITGLYGPAGLAVVTPEPDQLSLCCWDWVFYSKKIRTCTRAA